VLNSEVIDGFMRRDGYAAVFLVIALESAGLPLQGEATLIAAALFAATTGTLSLPLVIGAAAAGAIMEDNVGVAVGRSFGPPLLLHYGGRIGLDQSRLKPGRDLFARHGGSIVFLGRFVAMLRACAAILVSREPIPLASIYRLQRCGWRGLGDGLRGGRLPFRPLAPSPRRPLAVVFLAVALVAAVLGWRFLRWNKPA
jgi:membrane protein DedA with SNARE-associated domain